MSRTVHIVQRMAPGGIESIVLDFARLDPGVLLVSLEGEKASLIKDWPPLAELGERLITLAKPDGLRPALWFRLADIFKKHGTCAVVTHHIGPLVYAGIAAIIAKVARRIHVEHDGWHYNATKRRLLSRLVGSIVMPRRIAVSGATAMQVAKAIGAHRQTIIPNGIDLQRFRPRCRTEARAAFGLPENARLIGNVGRLEEVKGQDILIDALAHLDRNCHVVLAGDGSRRAMLEQHVKRLGLEDRVHFLGAISEPEALYPALDLFCLPSRAEGFPRTLIEAQACDLRVVACEVGGVCEAVCPSTGLLVPPGDVTALALALRDAFENPLDRSPRAFVDPTFSNALMIDRYRLVIEQ